MKANNIQSKIISLFDRTYRNCIYYSEEGKDFSLANEIGVLRGIAYCMEVVGLCPHTDRFLKFIEIQQNLKKRDEEAIK